MGNGLQPGVATGIGSLPHVCAQSAAEFSLTVCADLPFIPQLPNRHVAESMIPMVTHGLDGITIGSDGGLRVDVDRLDPLRPIRTDLGHEAFGGLRGFLDVARGHSGSVKWQIAGPLTVGLALVHAGVPASTAFDVAARAVRVRASVIRTAITDAMPAATQVVFIDEPSFLAVMCPGFPVAPDAAIDMVSAALAGLESYATTGVACGGDADVASLTAAGPDILSLPVSGSLVTFAGFIAGFLERGGWIAWGAVPTDRPLGSSGDHWWRELSNLWCSLVQAGCDPARLRTQAILTPTGGLDHHDEIQAERVLRLTSEVADRVADQATATKLFVGA